MRALLDAPGGVLEGEGARRVPRAGSFRGGLPPVDYRPLGAGRAFRLAHHKRWVYVALQSEELFCGVAIVDLGYAASAFAFVASLRERRLLADKSVMAPPWCCRISDVPGAEAHLRGVAGELHLTRPAQSTRYQLTVAFDGRRSASLRAIGDLRISAQLESAGAPPPISAIVELPGQPGKAGGPPLVNATEKRALLPVIGEVHVGGKSYPLDGLGGMDYTNGYLDRHTAWRWAFALGRAASGALVGLNLVQGFVGASECALWVGDQLYPLEEGRFLFDAQHPSSAPWQVRTADGLVDLRFDPIGAHAEHKDLLLVSSRFVQPVGLFHGRVQVPGTGETLLWDGVPGVVEDQDVRW